MMGGPGYGYGTGYGMMGGSWIGGLLLFFFGLLVLIGVVLLIVWAIRASSRHGHETMGQTPHGPAGHEEAIAIVKKRFASGEITKEQYDEIVRALGS
ncbi:MAG: SHOCT domain-containing protein [Coriobacteriia bacterium]